MLGDLYSFYETPVEYKDHIEVGTYLKTLMGPKKAPYSEYWLKGLELDPHLNDFDWPNRDADAEFTSFILQSSKRKEFSSPANCELEKSKLNLLNKYVKFKLSYSSLSYDTIKKLVEKFLNRHVKMDASPGIPYSMRFATNKQFIESSKEVIVDLVYSRIQARLFNRPECMTPIQLVQENLCDPVKIFVKQEPHKRRKLEEGRVRLIMSVSIIDKLVEMVLVSDLKEKEIANWATIPSKPGIGFTEQGIKIIYQSAMAMKRPVATDVSGFDWHVQQWMLDADADINIRLCENSFNEWEVLMQRTATIEGKSLYCLSNSKLLELKVKGIQNSGKLKTSMSNSKIRCLLADLVGSTDYHAMGDDDFEEWVEGAFDKYADLGMDLKNYDEVTDKFEFCSKLYSKEGAYPVDYAKTLMKYLHSAPVNWIEWLGYRIGFDDEMSQHPEYPRIVKLIRAVGFDQLGGEQKLLIESSEDEQ